MDSQIGEPSFTLELTLSDLLTVISAVQTHHHQSGLLAQRLASALAVPQDPQSILDPFQGRRVSMEELHGQAQRLFGGDPDGTTAVGLGSETPDASMEKTNEIKKDLDG